MMFRKAGILVGTTFLLALPATGARAHWCDDLWASSYNLTVRPDSDTSPKEVFVQNNMGYQLINFTLTASTASGAVTLTAPTTLKVAGTLLPGEKGSWKISGTSPAKIEDITFSVKFGNGSQSRYYPTSGAKAVMIVKRDGSLAPPSPPPGLASSVSTGNAMGRNIQIQSLADWEDIEAGLDKLLNLYCAGRASWGSTDGVSQTYCKDSASTSCPTSKPLGVGGKYDYIHLWAAGALAIRKASLGARLPVLRERLKCGVNDGDVGMAGYALFALGYLGDDAGARSFAQTQASGSGDLATIAKAALYMMGDTSQKAAVQAGVQSSSVFAKVACAGALGIVDKDDASVTSAIIPEVKWNEPDVSSEDGKGMYAAHVLEMVAYSRRGWVAKGVGEGAVTFYGETGSSVGGTGGSPGTGGVVSSGGTSGGGGSTGTGRDAGRDGVPGTGGRGGSGGTTAGAGGATSNGGTSGSGGVVGSGGRGGSTSSSSTGGAVGSGGSSARAGSGGSSAPASSGGAPGSGGSMAGGSAGSTSVPGSGGSAGGSTGTTVAESESSGCQCHLGRRTDGAGLPFLVLAGLGLLCVRRRRD